MDIYPQSQNGSICQFPFQKSLHYRTIVNIGEDGSRLALEDPNAAAISWKLSYSGLSDTERLGFETFFDNMSGRLKNFTFLDPSGNLLLWSEDFGQAVWHKSGLLTSSTGISDPCGTLRATAITNNGPGDLTLTQSVSVPGSYLCCLSCFVRSPNPATIQLTRDSSTKEVIVSSAWRRVFLTGASSGSESSVFGLTIPTGAQIHVFGMQVEAQTRPSTYVQTLDRSGVYPMTRFDSDTLTFSSDAPNSNSCEITLYCKLAL